LGSEECKAMHVEYFEIVQKRIGGRRYLYSIREEF
jgi:hypothetical protein